jgi:hypothetical protein
MPGRTVNTVATLRAALLGISGSAFALARGKNGQPE